MFDFDAAIAAVQTAVVTVEPPRKRPARKRTPKQPPLSVMAAETLMVDPAIGSGANVVPLSLSERHYEAWFADNQRRRSSWR
jgi:hypothetical protein